VSGVGASAVGASHDGAGDEGAGSGVSADLRGVRGAGTRGAGAGVGGPTASIQEGGVMRSEMCLYCGYIAAIATSRFHSGNVGQFVPVDFRNIQEKVEFRTRTGDKPHQHAFRRQTPTSPTGTWPYVPELLAEVHMHLSSHRDVLPAPSLMHLKYLLRCISTSAPTRMPYR